ncbi:MAG: heparinase II/III family protein [Lentisphaeria bacterium]|nr:heparinase II/III family protein [Lentisphaeria bacterium]
MNNRAAGVLAALLVAVTAAGAVVFPENNNWLQKIRPEHPRMMLSSDNLPLVREQCRTIRKAEFDRLKKEVDALPVPAKVEVDPKLIKQKADGSLQAVKADQKSKLLFDRNPARAANQAAFVYLVTGDKKYARIAHDWLKESLKILEWSEKLQIWADWQGDSRINMILAYDWVCQELTPEERREIMLPILDYLSKSRNDGKGFFTFRRTISSPQSGNYGENSMLLFAGMAAYGDGIDDARAEEMLRYGVKLYVDMLNYRDKLSAGSGLLTSSTVTYSFGAYPYASFFFFHLWESAFGENVAGRWQQMCDFPNWFDYAAIDLDENCRFLSYGIGDLMHKKNRFAAFEIYTHLAQTVHFYGQIRPQRMARTWELLKRIPANYAKIWDMYPALSFALTRFDPTAVDQVQLGQAPQSRYFYNPDYGLLLARSGTGPDDTYTAFRFGGRTFQHQHYDELSFVIYKKGFLAMDSGTRCSTAQHHNYAAQTVAHNSILIHQKDEPIPDFWRPWGFKDDNVPVMCHGGQDNVKSGKAVALHSTDEFIYAAGDATGSYNKSKSREVIRQFVYLKPDTYVIFDRVESVRPDQQKEVLFHAQNEPVALGNRVWRFDNGGSLFIHSLLPDQAAPSIVGGPGREFWASGRNWLPEGGDKWDQEYQTTGKWRLEIADAAGRKRSEFLHVLHAAAPGGEDVKTVHGTTAGSVWVEVQLPDGKRWRVEFARRGPVNMAIRCMTADGKLMPVKACPAGIEPLP